MKDYKLIKEIEKCINHKRKNKNLFNPEKIVRKQHKIIDKYFNKKSIMKKLKMKMIKQKTGSYCIKLNRLLETAEDTEKFIRFLQKEIK